MTAVSDYRFVEEIPDLIHPEEYADHPEGKLVRVSIRTDGEGVRVLGDALASPSNGSFRPRLRSVVRTQLAAVRQRLEDLRVLQGQLQEVLRHLEASSGRRVARRPGRCDCLDVRTTAR